VDDIVKAALAKWPHVPHCYGWLALDSRGDWYMRDDRTQAAGPFPNPKGSRIQHDKLLAFIHRNYACDAHGAWFFQNGPQRVYVELQAAPWVWRLTTNAAQVSAGSHLQSLDVHSHTGLATQVLSSWLCDADRLFLHTPLGLGLVHTADMHLAAGLVEAGVWQPQTLPFASMPARFGYQLKPRPVPAG
jgi:hypothetical protein